MSKTKKDKSSKTKEKRIDRLIIKMLKQWNKEDKQFRDSKDYVYRQLYS